MLSSYHVQIIILSGINVIMAASLNLITGYTGQLSIGHAAFMSIGAYASGLATLLLGFPFYLSFHRSAGCFCFWSLLAPNSKT